MTKATSSTFSAARWAARALWFAALLLAAFPLFAQSGAQSGQTLRGGVQQNQNYQSYGPSGPPSEQQVQSITADMYHQLSVMWGNGGASQDAQRAFQADVATFNGYVSAGSALAAKLAPCVSQYQQAYPHAVLQSQYYVQNNSAAFNSQSAIVDPLIKAGAACMNTAAAEVFSSNSSANGNSGKVYNTYRSRPSPPPAKPTYQLPYNGTPNEGAVPAPRVNPSPCAPPDTLPLNQRGAWYQANVLSGRIRCPGGYDPCANPDAPAWCPSAGQPSRAQPRPPAPTTCPAVPVGAWPALVQLETFTTQVANAARDGLVNDTQALAPRFDMTKSGEGVRYMATLLGNVGFRYLAANAPAALRAITTNKPTQLPQLIYGWAPGAGIPGGAPAGPFSVPSQKPLLDFAPSAPANLSGPTQLPAGVTLPAVLNNTPRPLQLQEQPATCGFACVKMLADTILRTPHPESFFQALVPEDPCGYTPQNGTYIQWLPQVLEKVGIRSDIKKIGVVQTPQESAQKLKQALQGLKTATDGGYPAIALTSPQQGASSGHYVVVDAVVTGANGSEWVIGRDPFNTKFLDATTRQLFEAANMRNYFVVPAPDFLSSWTGSAVTTKP